MWRTAKWTICAYSVLWGSIGWLFYEHVIGVVSVGLFGLFSTKRALVRARQRRQQWEAVQFEQLLQSLTTSLQAGRSVTNAFQLAEDDLRSFTMGRSTSFLMTVHQLNHKVRNGLSLERALLEAQVDLPQWSVWVDVFLSGKRSGTDIVAVMRHTARAIADHMARERELAILLAAKAFEAKILAIVPFVLVALFRYGSPAYMEPLYNGIGRWVMSGCLIVLLLAQWWADRIMTPREMTQFPMRFVAPPRWMSTFVVRTPLHRWLVTHCPFIVRQCRVCDPDGDDPSIPWLARGVLMWLVLALLPVVVAAFVEDPWLIGCLCAFVVVWPFVWCVDLDRRVRMRQQVIVAPLPTFVHKLRLLLQAGEPLLQAWQRASSPSIHWRQHPFYVYLSRTNALLTQATPFAKVLEQFQRWCGATDVHAFVATVLMNYQRGGEAFAVALQDTVRTLHKRQQASVRRKGEEASTQLLFPMLLMLATVLVLMATPAVLMMRATV